MFDYLTPVSTSFIDEIQLRNPHGLAKQVAFVSYENADELENAEIVIIGINETRLSTQESYHNVDLSAIRKELYALQQGNWHQKIADIGTIERGREIPDTYFAVQEVLGELLKKNKTVLILGGSQDLTYAVYKAHQEHQNTVNICAIDRKFDLGLYDNELTSASYLNHIITDEPRKLFNFYNIGHQSYYISQEELDLVTQMNFEYIRLGEVSDKNTEAEPYLRDSDLVTVDLSAIRYAESPAHSMVSPNGLTGKEICTLARYAGLSNKMRTFGVYEYNADFEIRNQSAQLIAQMLWYCIEGINLRMEEKDFSASYFQKYIIPNDAEEYIFYKSLKTERWWMELSFEKNGNQKVQISCTEDDYLKTVEGEITDRWWKNYKKYL